MRITVIIFCILGSVAVGLYVADIFNTNYVLSKFKVPETKVLTVEQYASFPHNDLAEFSQDSQAVQKQVFSFSNEQQAKLRHAILVLAAWSTFLLLVIVLGRTKALNQFSLPRPNGAGLANARRS